MLARVLAALGVCLFPSEVDVLPKRVNESSIELIFCCRLLSSYPALRYKTRQEAQLSPTDRAMRRVS